MRPLLQDLGLLLVLLKDPAEDFQNCVPIPLVQQLPAVADRLQRQPDSKLQTAVRQVDREELGGVAAAHQIQACVGQVGPPGSKCNAVQCIQGLQLLGPGATNSRGLCTKKSKWT